MRKFKVLIVLLFCFGFVFTSQAKRFVASEVVEETQEVEETEKKSSLAILIEDKVSLIITALSGATATIGVIASFIKLVNKFLKKKLELAEQKINDAKDDYFKLSVKIQEEKQIWENKLLDLTNGVKESTTGLQEHVTAFISELKNTTEDTVNSLKEQFENTLKVLESKTEEVVHIQEDVTKLKNELEFELTLLKTYLLNSKQTVSDGISRQVAALVQEHEEKQSEGN